ncbi:hypothetical protein N7540_002134 [Penicillium herquei]|nr:hypothetical protein N7540_002134 [Penicillium herquei]
MGSSQYRPDTWFDRYIGTEMSFGDGSTWRLNTKIHEFENQESQQVCDDDEIESEARALFLCAKVAGDGPFNAVIKMRMQVPWTNTDNDTPEDRAQQAGSTFNISFFTEVEALDRLTETECSVAPALLSHKDEKQTDDEWVPGGYKRSILMEHVPGSCLKFEYSGMSDGEKNRVRSAFKIAWQEAIECGCYHDHEDLENLVWDSDGNVCYLVDWEWWDPANKTHVWTDDRFGNWGL